MHLEKKTGTVDFDSAYTFRTIDSFSNICPLRTRLIIQFSPAIFLFLINVDVLPVISEMLK